MAREPLFTADISDYDAQDKRSTFGMWASGVIRRLSSPAKLLQAVGLFVSGKVMKHFDNPSLQILGSGAKGKPLINQHGASGLMGSIVSRMDGADAVEVGSNKPYTRIHAMGGIIKAKGDGWLTFMVGGGRGRTTSGRAKKGGVWRRVKQVTIPQRNIWWLPPGEEREVQNGVANFFLTGAFNTHD